jgi:hypothetical protein
MPNDTRCEHGQGRSIADAARVRDTGAPSLEQTNAPVPAISPSQKLSSWEHIGRYHENAAFVALTERSRRRDERPRPALRSAARSSDRCARAALTRRRRTARAGQSSAHVIMARRVRDTPVLWG